MSPIIFYINLSTITKIDINPSLEDRRCVISRSPGYFGNPYNCIIELEGSPPKNPVFCYGTTPVCIAGQPIRASCREKAKLLVENFLEAHPPSADGSPVWIEVDK